MKSVLKRAGLVISFLLIIGLGIIMSTYFHIMNPDSIYISESKVTEQSITLAGGFMESASLYRGYNADYHDHALYVQIKGNIISFPKSSGDFHLDIKNKYNDIHKVYIQGSNEADHKLVWEKK